MRKARLDRGRERHACECLVEPRRDLAWAGPRRRVVERLGDRLLDDAARIKRRVRVLEDVLDRLPDILRAVPSGVAKRRACQGNSASKLGVQAGDAACERRLPEPDCPTRARLAPSEIVNEMYEAPAGPRTTLRVPPPRGSAARRAYGRRPVSVQGSPAPARSRPPARTTRRAPARDRCGRHALAALLERKRQRGRRGTRPGADRAPAPGRESRPASGGPRCPGPPASGPERRDAGACRAHRTSAPPRRAGLRTSPRRGARVSRRPPGRALRRPPQPWTRTVFSWIVCSHPGLGRYVEASRRLVHHDQPRPVHNRHRDRNPLLLTARQLVSRLHEPARRR